MARFNSSNSTSTAERKSVAKSITEEIRSKRETEDIDLFQSIASKDGGQFVVTKYPPKSSPSTVTVLLTVIDQPKLLIWRYMSRLNGSEGKVHETTHKTSE